MVGGFMNRKDKEVLDEVLFEETTEYKKFNEVFNNIEKKKKKKRKIVVIFSIIIFLLLIFTILLYMYFCKERVVSIDIKVKSYDKDTITFEITPLSNESFCAYSKFIDGKLEFIKMEDNKCIITTSIDEFYIYFKNNTNIVSKGYLVDNYLIDVSIKDNYYLLLNSKEDLSDKVVKFGDIKLTYNIIDKSILEINDNVINTLSIGETIVEVLYNNEKVKEFNVVVTDVIVSKPKEFDTKKKYLPCEVFTLEEAKLLDTILEDRINEVGNNTRAAVVEAARFLMLEFPYRLNYFFENGRLDVSGVHYVDGEGRYYHKGLYLSKEKENDIKYTFVGPAMWGCPLRNFEDTYLFKKYKDYPNGLDCSGFVAWTLVNGGYDPGDLGAGNSEDDPRELADLGEYEKITDELIKSNRIKVGDLLNIWGHIGILVGIDDKNFYVAESLDIYGGVVIKTYSKKKISNTFPYIVLMDDYYKEDGKLTDMWY